MVQVDDYTCHARARVPYIDSKTRYERFLDFDVHNQKVVHADGPKRVLGEVQHEPERAYSLADFRVRK